MGSQIEDKHPHTAGQDFTMDLECVCDSYTIALVLNYMERKSIFVCSYISQNAINSLTCPNIYYSAVVLGGASEVDSILCFQVNKKQHII